MKGATDENEQETKKKIVEKVEEEEDEDEQKMKDGRKQTRCSAIKKRYGKRVQQLMRAQYTYIFAKICIKQSISRMKWSTCWGEKWMQRRTKMLVSTNSITRNTKLMLDIHAYICADQPLAHRLHY